MMLRYQRLLSLRVEHAYYASACEDVGFVIPQATARVLQGAGLVAKLQAGVLSIYFRADERGEPVRPGSAARLRIGLEVTHPAFANVTEGFDPAAGALYFSKDHSNPDLGQPPALAAPSRVELVGRSVSWALVGSERPVSVALVSAAGIAFRTQTALSGDVRSLAFDLGSIAAGPFALEETSPSGVRRVPHYLDPELWQRGVFAIVELELEPAFYVAAPQFSIAFGARLETLRYYVVARGFSNGDLDQLDVRDPTAPAGAALTFAPVAAADLSAAEQAQVAVLGADGAKVLLFRSSAAVARRQLARKRIQLLRKDEALVENLPQPGRERTSADLIVHLSKSKA